MLGVLPKVIKVKLSKLIAKLSGETSLSPSAQPRNAGQEPGGRDDQGLYDAKLGDNREDDKM